jgi:DNA-binding NarL/FixJ family response regulator
MGLKIVIVEDDSFTRLTLESAIREMGFHINLATASASDAISCFNAQITDVVVLDLHLGPGPTGVDIATAYRKRHPTGGVVFLTSYSDPRLLSASVGTLPDNSVYLNKANIGSMADLQAAIESAANPELGSRVATDTQTLANLTPGQLEILRLVAEGLSNAEIAKKTFITEKSVETAISRIAKALNLSADVTRNQRVHIAKVYFRAIGLNVTSE